ncbi:pseudouridine synthase [Mycoplasmopsis felis]|uniref:pseudouridine synthase n=1 Tax=Mycoplasmopsis felis TaxID=33923 RepID=UPI00056BAFDD|nr:16S rRNA pseudouridine(516) synthase [Mycoplasmopsis felis]
MIRIDKYISSMTDYSRNDVKKLIKNKKIKVNNVFINKVININQTDQIFINEQLLIEKPKYIYLLMNKPKGYICANNDKINHTVFDLLDSYYLTYKGLHTVGRLDKDTEGLLIITNDGEFTHNVLSPNKHIHKTYYVTVDKELDNSLINEFKNGVNLNDFVSKSSKLKIIDKYNCYITISEGKYHQVKRMFLKFGYKVKYLNRVKFGKLCLPRELKTGQYKEIKLSDVI